MWSKPSTPSWQQTLPPDDASKRTVLDLAAQLGFDAVDAGPLNNARYLEPAIVLLLQLAYGMHMGTGIGLALARG